MSIDDKKIYRNELKFLCPASNIEWLKHRMMTVLNTDENAGSDGGYTVSSVYFDDYQDSCCQDNDAGTGNRFKYRIRTYNNNPEIIQLEKKAKKSTLCHKTMVSITREQFEKLCEGDVLDLLQETDNALLREFCIQINTRRYVPKVIVEYERVAFVNYAGNVRITLDQNIAASYQTVDLFEKDKILCPILNKNMHLLEVKFDDFFPPYIQNLIQMNNMVQTTFSKYFLCRQKLAMTWR